MVGAVHILVAVHNPQLRLQIGAALNVPATIVETSAQFWQALDTQRYNLILVDFAFWEANHTLLKQQPRPTIVVAEQGNIRESVAAIKTGATDYLVLDETFRARLNDVIHHTMSLPLIDQVSSEFLRSEYDESPMMLIFDNKGIVHDANRRCLLELGYTRDQLVGRPLVNILTHESAQRVMEGGISRLWREGEVTNAEHQAVARDGTILDIEMNCRVLKNTAGPLLAIAVARNVTEHKRVASAEQQQRIMAEALRDTTFALTSTLNFDEVLDRILTNVARVVPYDTAIIMLIEGSQARMVRNRRAADPEREIGVPTVDFVIDHIPTLRQMYMTGKALAIPDVTTYPDWVDLPQSAWIKSFIGAPIRDGDHIIGFLTLNGATLGMFSDRYIERLQAFANQAAVAIRNARLYDAIKRHAEELEQRVARRTAQLNLERNQLSAILESTGEGIFYAEGQYIRYANLALEQLTGYHLDEMIDQPVTTLFNVASWQGILDAVKAEGIWRDELKLTCKDGSEIDSGLTVALGGQDDDVPLRTVAVVRDIRQEKALHNQKLRFIANASHELRTPIQNIITRLYLIDKQPERTLEHVKVIEDVTRRMRNLVEDLLDLSRFDRGVIPMERHPVDVGALVNKVVAVQLADAQLKNIRLSTRTASDPLYVLADEERLTQVITNLVVNALNYTPSGGSVTIKLHQTENHAIIQVEDTGIGIDPAEVEHIFEPFVRLNQDRHGSGLGLSIAREIIEMHNGSIDVVSTPGQGTNFTISLQLSPVAVTGN